MRGSAYYLLFLLLFTFNSSVRAFQSDQVAAEEAQDYYKKWLDEDVKYIITDEERSVFDKLQTDAERDAFIEQFWRRRDPDPSTAANEYKEEYYRRIAYANEHFTLGLAGWKTDRGMIYIKYGQPDDIDDHPGRLHLRSSQLGRRGHHSGVSVSGSGATTTSKASAATSKSSSSTPTGETSTASPTIGWRRMPCSTSPAPG